MEFLRKIINRQGRQERQEVQGQIESPRRQDIRLITLWKSISYFISLSFRRSRSWAYNSSTRMS